MNATQPVRRMSALSAAIFGVTAVVMTVIASVTAVVFYGLTMVDRKTDTLTETARALLEELPAIRAALPPALADAVSDVRRPEYAPRLKIEVGLPQASDRGRRVEPVISVENTGDEVVSMLALRIVALNSAGAPIREWTEYLATPLAIEDEWRGPLLPSSTRRAVLNRSCPKDTASVEYEVTELRVWERNAELESASTALGS